MKYPRPIRKGDILGVTAPSSGVTDPLDLVRMQHGVDALVARGYAVLQTPNVFTNDDQGRSSPAEQKVEEFNSLLENPDVSCIFSAKGGDWQYEMLPLVDWSLWESNPKWFQGYSDNTVLGFKATAEHDVATMYAGNFGDFGMDPWHISITDDIEVLEGTRDRVSSYEFHEDGFHDRVTGLETVSDDSRTWWKTSYCDERFSGRLLGGCMDVLEWFCLKDTADPSRFIESYGGEGIVWFMETYSMDAARIGRMFKAMREKGWLKDASGFIFGRPLMFGGEFAFDEDSYIDSVMDAIADLEAPAVFDADVGHKAPRMPFVNGARADVSVSSGACEIRYSFKRCPIRMRKRPNRTEYHPIRSLTYNRMRMDGRCSG